MWENEIFTHLNIFADQAAAKTQCIKGNGNLQSESNRIKSDCKTKLKIAIDMSSTSTLSRPFLKSYSRSQVVRQIALLTLLPTVQALEVPFL